MHVVKFVKYNVFLISFAMFCYQLNIATQNLLTPAMIDITYERNITADDMPLITICPTNQTNFTRLDELKYYDIDYLLTGDTKCNATAWCTSWGAHLNLTFGQLISQIFHYDKAQSLAMIEGMLEKNSVFIPGYGLCRETSYVDVTKEIGLVHTNPDEARVLITNRNYRSYFMPDITSHKGSKIFIEPESKQFIDVHVLERNLCKNDDVRMTGNDFRKCVDDKVQHEFEVNNIECTPPWLSDNKQCNQSYFEPILKAFKHTYMLEIEKLGLLINTKFEKDCKNSCKETTYVVNKMGAKKDFLSRAYIFFNQKVVVTEKVANYDMFKYIIDVGSSLGLWLGLSVLGLHDLVVWAVQFVNNSFIIKKIRSAVAS